MRAAATLTQTDHCGQPLHRAADLEALFSQCFERVFATRLQGGAEEPLYRAAGAGGRATILYTRDYFRSALHEIAHWCVAGPARRRKDDYGYWYAPEGRDAAAQREFERVETLPQAWELVFCAACCQRFRVSADNLDNMPTDLAGFEDAVLARAHRLLHSTSSSRGLQWGRALAAHYRGSAELSPTWIEECFSRW